MFKKLLSRKLWVALASAVFAVTSGQVDLAPVIGAVYVAVEGVTDAAGALGGALRGGKQT